MHIPYGLCYALIANVSPIYGIYTSFFPVLVYFIFGTSRHLSIGTASLIALLTSNIFDKLTLKYIPADDYDISNQNLTASLNQNYTTGIDNKFLSSDREQAKVLVMIATAFWVGIFQVIMFIFHLGTVTSYLGEAMIKGFIVGCSLHVFTSQLGHLFGLHIHHEYGLFELPRVS